MGSRRSMRWLPLLLGGLALLCIPLMYGCSAQGKFSKEEEQQLKQGPPSEMPPQAREMMERMRQGGGNVPPPPPRPKGQPGPGAPVAPR